MVHRGRKKVQLVVGGREGGYGGGARYRMSSAAA